MDDVARQRHHPERLRRASSPPNGTIPSGARSGRGVGAAQRARGSGFSTSPSISSSTRASTRRRCARSPRSWASRRRRSITTSPARTTSFWLCTSGSTTFSEDPGQSRRPGDERGVVDGRSSTGSSTRCSPTAGSSCCTNATGPPSSFAQGGSRRRIMTTSKSSSDGCWPTKPCLLRDRVRLACSLGAVMSGLLLAGDMFSDVSGHRARRVAPRRRPRPPGSENPAR
jgi:hypothetical protein